MLFPNEIQAAVLFDRQAGSIEDIARDFVRIEQARSGVTFAIPEAKPGAYVRLYGDNQLSIILEQVDRPCDAALFDQALASGFGGLLFPDARERLARHRSHILVNVSHGVMGNITQDPKFAKLFEDIGILPEGHSLPQFRRRLDVLALVTRIACDLAPALAVHWVQSNLLIPSEKFDTFASEPAISPLHVHPFLFRGEARADGEVDLGINTFGARHFIEREVIVKPNPLPWSANFDTIMAFLRVATMPNGYVIPHGDTFGPEDHSQSYRVLHHAAEDGKVPLYELVPLRFDEYGFRSPDYVPRDRILDDRAPPPELMPQDPAERQRLVDEWREKREMVEGIGGRFEVRPRNMMPPPPGAPGAARRPIFGRRSLFGR